MEYLRLVRGPVRRKAAQILPLLLLLLAALARPGGAAAGESRVLPQLQDEAKARPTDQFRVIVTRIDNNPAADREVNNRRGRKVKDLPHNAFVAELPGSEIEALGRDPAVKFVAFDAPVISTGVVDTSNLVSLYPQVVNASSLWGGTNPVTGKGVAIAILDTGISTSPDDFKGSKGVNRVVKQMLFNSSTTNMSDLHGHGTHVAGVAAGNSWTRRDLKGKYIGIAPEANILNIKVSDDQGMSYVSDVVTAIDWVVNNREAYNIRVMNLSLVSSVAESYHTSTLAAAVERAWFNGIAVVVAAGNSGPNTMLYPPANDPFVITVGAADTMGTLSRSDDGMAPWSSYGVTQNGVVKPEIVAPGRMLVAPLASKSSTLAKNFPERMVEGGEYIRLSGTSVSAPIVAGIAALAFQQHPEWTNDQVKWLLQSTASKLGGSNLLPGQGAGLVDASLQVKYSGIPQFANQNLVISSQLRTPNGATAYNSASWSTASWSTASWSTASWSTAHGAQTTTLPTPTSPAQLLSDTPNPERIGLLAGQP